MRVNPKSARAATAVVMMAGVSASAAAEPCRDAEILGTWSPAQPDRLIDLAGWNGTLFVAGKRTFEPTARQYRVDMADPATPVLLDFYEGGFQGSDGESEDFQWDEPFEVKHGLMQTTTAAFYDCGCGGFSLSIDSFVVPFSGEPGGSVSGSGCFEGASFCADIRGALGDGFAAFQQNDDLILKGLGANAGTEQVVPGFLDNKRLLAADGDRLYLSGQVAYRVPDLESPPVFVAGGFPSPPEAVSDGLMIDRWVDPDGNGNVDIVFQAYDVTPDGPPVDLSQLVLPLLAGESPRSEDLYEGRLFVATNQRILVIDYAVPSMPVLEAEFGGLGEMTRVAPGDGVIYAIRDRQDIIAIAYPGCGGCGDADLAEPFGVLDLADLQAFVGAFVSGDPLADLAEPQGVLDLADVQAFVGSFNAGCP